ncbi:ATP-binding protein [Selenihalanaerobacter shriftii]|uniref:histidine kinase n=1 Tax=Selenihalanaerobacter shriftii TaxID=142842 RepID=A0A1T4MJY7_9FIRM|nr:ATP-binding protein [Selenihalanaerobacter shriftii]SJZ67349.1 Histidine kinase-, DNA gyrase B-, and HSP90-like ATPase [Selenihalanaerobacter shriftii]
MKELSLNILDLVQNSIKADATEVKIKINEDLDDNLLVIIIKDNGNGMSKDFLENVLDPFKTTRTTRNVGLGLPLFQTAAKRCDGDLIIDSQEGEGTTVKATFQHDHIDRAPLGNIEGTLTTIIQGNPELDIYYQHIINDQEFVFDTKELRKKLEDIPLNESSVIKFIREYLVENLAILKEEEIK